MAGGKSYGAAERQLARLLDRFPRARGLAKKAYQRINYLAFRKRGVSCELHPDVRLLTPMQWAGHPDIDGEWFFGYYDKPPWSPDMSRALFHRPRGRQVEIIAINRKSPGLETLATTTAWNAQQGSQTQWLPGAAGEAVIFNDFVDGRLGCRIVGAGGDERFIPWPVQAVHPGGRAFLSLNYKRLHRIRPEYGYSPPANNFTGDEPLDRDGLWRVDLDTGREELILSLESLARHASRTDMHGAQHKVNHAIYSPSGARFVFMHRWVSPQGKFSRLYVADSNGDGLRLLLDERMVSHYHWRDDEHLVVWGRTAEVGDHYYLINVKTGRHEIVGEGVLDVWGDGHPSFSPDGQWIVTDTYPDRARMRQLMIFHPDSGKLIKAGRFLAPWAYDGAVRCDLHPRWSPDGRWISIDSAHEGLRRSYFIDVSEICS